MYAQAHGSTGRFRFDDFEANGQTGELCRHGERVPIQDVPFKLLLALLERQGEVVSKHELREEIWPSEVNLDFNSALDTAVHKARMALGDTGREHRYIATLPGRGYRFLVPVTHGPSAPLGGGAPTVQQEPGWRRVWLSRVLPLTLILLLITCLVLINSRRSESPRWDPRCVAVLDFMNRTGDPSVDAPYRQVRDQLRQELQRVGNLRVAWAASEPSSTDVEASKVARGLRARFLAVGECYLQGPDLEFRVRLIDPWNHRLLYSLGPWRGPRGGLDLPFTELRQYAAGAIAWSFDEHLGLEPGSFRPPRLDAFLAFERAVALSTAGPRDILAGRIASEFGKSGAIAVGNQVLASCDQALSIQPDFLLPRVWKYYELRFANRSGEAAAEVTRLEEALEQCTPVERCFVRLIRATEEKRYLEALLVFEDLRLLHPDTPQLRLQRAAYELSARRPGAAIRDLAGVPTEEFRRMGFHDWQRNSVLACAYHLAGDYEAELRTARESQVAYPGILQFYGDEAAALAGLGRPREAEQVLLRLTGVRPRQDSTPPQEVALITMLELRAHGQRDACLRVADQLMAAHRTLPVDRARELEAGLLDAMCLLGSHGEVLEIARRRMAAAPGDPRYLARYAAMLVKAGQLAEARRIDRGLVALGVVENYDALLYHRACIAAQLGERERSVALLGQALGEGFPWSIHLHLDPYFEPVRGYPPFEEILKPQE